MIVAVSPIETRMKRSVVEYRRYARWRVQSDDQYEDAERVMVAPFHPLADWNDNPIPALPIMQPYTWGDDNDGTAPTKPDGEKVMIDDTVYLTSVDASQERPVDAPDGHRYFWMVTAEWMDPPTIERLFGVQDTGEKRFKPTRAP